MLEREIKNRKLGIADFRRISEECNNYSSCENCPDKEICEMLDSCEIASNWNEEDWEKIEDTIMLVGEMGEYCNAVVCCDYCPFYALCSEMNDE